MDSKKTVLWITRTAIFLALLIAFQFITAPLGTTLVTGSLVNLMLIVSVMTCGLPSGLTVAVISPVLAKLLGVGPLWEIIPFIILGNITISLLWHLIGNRKIVNTYVPLVIAAIVAGTAKFAVLYFSIVQIAIPFLLNLPEQQAAVISGMFSVSQLFTALIGGTVAIIVIPPLRKVIKKQI